MGQGEIRPWIRDTDGNWLETNEIVFNWIPSNFHINPRETYQSLRNIPAGE